MRRLGLKRLKVYLDSTGGMRGSLALYGLPITYLINPQGLVIGYIVGAVEWGAPKHADSCANSAGDGRQGVEEIEIVPPRKGIYPQIEKEFCNSLISR